MKTTIIQSIVLLKDVSWRGKHTHARLPKLLLNPLVQPFPSASHWTRSSFNGNLFWASLLKSSSSITSNCQSRWLVFLPTRTSPSLINYSTTHYLPKKTFFFFFVPSRWSTTWVADLIFFWSKQFRHDRSILFKAISSSMILDSGSSSGSISQPTALTWALPRKQELSLILCTIECSLSQSLWKKERKEQNFGVERRTELETNPGHVFFIIRCAGDVFERANRNRCWEEKSIWCLFEFLSIYTCLGPRNSCLMTFLLSVGINVERQVNAREIDAFIPFLSSIIIVHDLRSHLWLSGDELTLRMPSILCLPFSVWSLFFPEFALPIALIVCLCFKRWCSYVIGREEDRRSCLSTRRKRN